MTKTNLFFTTFFISVIGFSQALEKGDQFLNVTIGQAFVGSYEYALSDNFTIGPYGSAYKDTYKKLLRRKQNNIL